MGSEFFGDKLGGKKTSKPRSRREWVTVITFGILGSEVFYQSLLKMIQLLAASQNVMFPIRSFYG